MILLFGPAGAGKSVQGRLLTERLDWRWLSTGQLIRDSQNPELLEIINAGNLLPTDKMNQLLSEELQRRAGTKTVLDGYPRRLDQAEWLVEHVAELNESIDLVVMLSIPKEELVRRLVARGRVDDTPEVILERLTVHLEQSEDIINFLKSCGVAVEQVNGVGEIEEIHQRIKAAMQQHGLIKEGD